MADENLVLRPKIIIEGLVDRFVAQPHTISPVQAAMSLAFLHKPLLESYLQSPQPHVKASANPDLRGGYFINIREDRAGELRYLLDSINRDRPTCCGSPKRSPMSRNCCAPAPPASI
ncbi:hypothetical protein AB0B63_01330 [Micromonospora sp. NPDC049081]|uniref:hypothetical protein n=1 Tax=Micromonospora sp. NPDC049081 TaxID=3155150 RepID=UPI0033F53E9F